MTTQKEMNILKWTEKGFEEKTAIQEETAVLIAEGKDVVGISPTGTGKTLAYVLPLLEKLEANHELQTLVIVPSQELAQQIGEVIREWKLPEITVQVLAGGANLKRQLENLKKKPEIVVGTPGRLMELSTQRKLKLHQLKTIVLDEADYLLQPEHLQQTRELLKKCPSQRQLLCFSATKNQSLEDIQQWINTTPVVVDVTNRVKAASVNVRHAYVLSPVRKKDELLRKFANTQQFHALVFVNSLANAGILAEKLQYHGIRSALLTSQAHQSERQAAIQAFKKGEVSLLLTTDVASRGLDIDDLPVVIHYDLPESKDLYTHRSGRTGRMGKEGLVLSFITERELRDLKRLVPENIKVEAFEVYAGEVKQAQKKEKVSQPKKKSSLKGQNVSKKGKYTPAKKKANKTKKR